MTTIDATTINLLDPRFYVDPFESYRWLRDNEPVFWDPIQRVWGISRYEDVVAIENNTKRYTSVYGSRPRIDQHSDTSMINRDDPEHQDQRRLVARQFTPRRREADRGPHPGRGHRTDRRRPPRRSLRGDHRARLPLPAIMIGEKLGYPHELWPKLREWSEITMYESAQNHADGSDAPRSPRSDQAIMEFAVATMELVAKRRAEPQNDLISTWTQTDVHGETWTDGEIISEAMLLLDGGAETTRTVIGAIIRELALRPDQRQLLVDDPSMLGETAVEEFIRWVTPILNMRRTATEDHELHGQQLRAGDELLLMYGSANRDERAFHDPDVFDVTRGHNRHVAFGIGTHFCLGASLARIEIRVMFEELLRRIPDWRIAPGTEPAILPATFARAYDEVHIEFTPSTA